MGPNLSEFPRSSSVTVAPLQQMSIGSSFGTSICGSICQFIFANAVSLLKWHTRE